ncbi:MAG: anti-sigma factor antagonist [Clostridia bacterium]|nr:anti-sigma factor antagonist [Clostridia bacterium]
MQYTLENSRLTLYLEGRIDAGNAPAWESEIFSVLGTHHGAELVMDAAGLSYISSAGLRILMKLRRQTGKAFPVLNASPEVYDILHVTGFTELLDVHRRLRQVATDGCELIGRGGNGAVYRLDPETILKLYNEGTSLEKIALKKKYATAAFTAGVPCAIAYDTVQSGHQYGIVFELLNAVTVGKAVHENPSLIPEAGKAMGALLRQLHATELPAGVLPRMTDRMNTWIDYLEKTYLAHSDAELLRSVLHAIPERNTLVHADFHEGNVMRQGNELILIDLDDISAGHPLYDLMAHYICHVMALSTTPETACATTGMCIEEIQEMYRYTIQAYLGTEDAQALDIYGQRMQLLSLFFTLIYLAKGKDSRNLTQARAQGIIDQILPMFRQMVPAILEAVHALAE